MVTDPPANPSRPGRTRLGWTVLTLVAGLAVPELFAILPDRFIGQSPSAGSQFLVFVLYFAVVVALVLLVLRADGVPLRAIGIRRPGWMTVVTGVALWGVGTLVLPLVSEPLGRLFGTGGVQAGLDELTAMPPALRAFVALGGAVEELLYRGFAIERLTGIAGRPSVAGAIAAAIFGLAHAPSWGLGFALSADLPLGIYMTLFYLWRRDLVANMIAHSTGLLVAMFTVV